MALITENGLYVKVYEQNGLIHYDIYESEALREREKMATNYMSILLESIGGLQEELRNKIFNLSYIETIKEEHQDLYPEFLELVNHLDELAVFKREIDHYIKGGTDYVIIPNVKFPLSPDHIQDVLSCMRTGKITCSVGIYASDCAETNYELFKSQKILPFELEDC